MSLKRIGEDGLIEHFKKGLLRDKSVIKGIGDDAAVIKSGTQYLLATCDILIEGTHFKKSDSAYLVGKKSISVSVSDIAAMGGIPKYALVSLGLPASLNRGYVFDLWKGIKSQAKKFKVSIVGGDTVRAKNVTIDITLIGGVKRKRLVLRSGAKVNDVIFVTGELGGSIRKRHLAFEPRLKESQFLVKNFKISSMIDLSDGLIKDLSRILKDSRVGACLFEELIPVHKGARNFNEALYMGEDFELLFTVRPKEAERLMRNKTYKFYPIGEITKDKKLELFDKNLRKTKLHGLGFKHF